jgi:hypothetical protein
MLRLWLLCLLLFHTVTPAVAAPVTPPPHGSIDLQYSGDIDYSTPVRVLNLDGFDTSADTVAQLRARGVYPICYINIGASEDWRPDLKDFAPEVMGKAYEGWEGEHWLDIRRIDLLGPIMGKRLDMCKAKGFLGVDPDNLDNFQQDTGFSISKTDQLRYLGWFATEAHKRGLAVGLKNIPEFAPILADTYDWALTESCFVQGWCEEMRVFTQRGKPVYIVEYTDEEVDLPALCAHARQHGFIALLKHRELDGKFRRSCE